MNQPPKHSPAVARLNALVEEFDRATGFIYERLDEPHFMAMNADLWSDHLTLHRHVRPDLGDDLREAAFCVDQERHNSIQP